MIPPEILWTDELRKSIADMEALRTDLFIAGADMERLDDLIEAVRVMDAEIVAARHVFRCKELSPYYPENYQAEEDGYEAAEKLLRGPVPEGEEQT